MCKTRCGFLTIGLTNLQRRICSIPGAEREDSGTPEHHGKAGGKDRVTDHRDREDVEETRLQIPMSLFIHVSHYVYIHSTYYDVVMNYMAFSTDVLRCSKRL